MKLQTNLTFNDSITFKIPCRYIHLLIKNQQTMELTWVDVLLCELFLLWRPLEHWVTRTFGRRYFSLRHTRSVALSAFLCKKSASLSILKEKIANVNTLFRPSILKYAYCLIFFSVFCWWHLATSMIWPLKTFCFLLLL